MNFDFSNDEKMIRDQVARFLSEQCDSKVVRGILEGDENYSQGVWTGLAEMGVMATAIPEAYGGVGAGYPSLCLVAEQIGAHLAPVPFASSVYLATEALLQFGSDDQKESWVPRLASGELIGTLAADAATSCRVEAGKLSGKKMIVADGGIADFALILAEDEKARIGLYLVELNHNSVKRENLQTIDPSKNSSSLYFDAADAELIGGLDAGIAEIDRIYDRAAVLVAFEQLGGAARALDMAVNYARERFAFGRPIGSFQGLKHMMADMYVALKLAESNCYFAAWALDTQADELPLAAATARVSATQAYQLCTRDNIQVHGGMGFTWEFDCHLYYRRSNYLTLILGGLSEWEDKLVDCLPDERAA